MRKAKSSGRRQMGGKKLPTWLLGLLVVALAGFIFAGPRLLAQQPGGSTPVPVGQVVGTPAPAAAEHGGGEAIQLPFGDDAWLPLYIVLGARARGPGLRRVLVEEDDEAGSRQRAHAGRGRGGAGRRDGLPGAPGEDDDPAGHRHRHRPLLPLQEPVCLYGSPRAGDLDDPWRSALPSRSCWA